MQENNPYQNRMHSSRRNNEIHNYIPFQSLEDLQFGFFYPTPENPESEVCYYWKLSNQRNKGKMHFIVESRDKIQIVIEYKENKFTQIEFPHSPKNQWRPKQSSISYYFLDGCPTFSHLDFQFSTQSRNLGMTEATSNLALDNFNDPLLRTYLARSTILKVRRKSYTQRKKKTGKDIPWKETNLRNRMPFLTERKLQSSEIRYETQYRLLCCLTQLTIDLFLFTEKTFRIFNTRTMHGKRLESSLIDKVLEDFCLQDIQPQIRPDSYCRFEEEFWKKYQRELKSKFSVAGKEIQKFQIKNVYLTPSITIYSFKDLHEGNAVLRKYSTKSDQFLIVNIRGEDGDNLNASHPKLLFQEFRAKIEKLYILTRTFRFLAYSASQLRKASCWMLNESTNLTVQKIWQEIGDLQNLTNPAKYGARLGQLFANSRKGMTIDRTRISYEVIPDLESPKDVEGGSFIYSDGIGMISENLVNQMKSNLNLSGNISAFQVRIGGVKGVLAMNKCLPDNTIKVRPSMIKYGNSAFENEIGVLSYNKYKPAKLNRQIILLLETRGIAPEVFLDLQKEYEKTLKRRKRRKYQARANHYGTHSERALKIIQQMKKAKMLTKKKNDFFGHEISQILRHKEYIHQEIGFRQKANIPVSQGAVLMGVLDEFGVLGPNEVFICISRSNGLRRDQQIIHSKVSVTKSPCLHPGDLDVVHAVNREEVQKVLGHFLNSIVFPFNKGERPHPNRIGGADLDGDNYFITWDQRLVPKWQTESQSYDSPPERVQEVTNQTLIDFFCEFNSNFDLGKLAHSHLALADKSSELANSPECLHLSKLHSQEIDYAKTGYKPLVFETYFAKEFPDFMEKFAFKSYISTTTLGELYRSAKKTLEKLKPKPLVRIKTSRIDKNFLISGFKDYLSECFKIKECYAADIESIQFKYNLKTEAEIFASTNLNERCNDEYTLHKTEESIAKVCKELYNKYHKLFYQNTNSSNVFQKVSALYFACYYRNSGKFRKCWTPAIKKSRRNLKPVGLPWLIAGDKLIAIQSSKEFLSKNKN